MNESLKIDWDRYNELLKKPLSDLTTDELSFMNYMYLVEEFRGGLDGI